MSAHIPRVSRSRRAGLAAASLLVVLTGCSTGSAPADQDGPGASGASSASPAGGPAVGPLTVERPWLKAADQGMTGAFVQLRNDGGAPVTITGATADDVAEYVELHETATDQGTGGSSMRQRADPLTIQPGETAALEPGGDHLMLMDLTCAPQPGTALTVTLDFEGGGHQELIMPVRDYAAAQEEYLPDSPSAQMTGAHGGHDTSVRPTASQAPLPPCESGS